MFILTNAQKSFIRKGGISFLTFFILVVPVVMVSQVPGQVFAQSPVPGDANFVGPLQDTGLVPCDGPKSIAGSDARTCNFQTLLQGINYIINWMFIIAIPISLVSFSYAGILFMTGKESNITQGKEIFSKVVWGVVIMAGAWLLVRTIVRGLLNPSGSFGSYLFGL